MQALRTCSKRFRHQRIPINSQLILRRNFAMKPSAYPRPLSILHWTIAGGVLSCFALIEVKKREPKGSPRIGTLMHYHKSIGVLLAGLVAARVGVRVISTVANKIPGHLKGAPKWMQMAADASHIGLYSFMIFMPASGIAMGYYGGKGLPFFWTKVPGTDTPNKSIAGASYRWHKRVGKAFEILVGAHIGGAMMHVLMGDAIFSRINPFKAVSVGIIATVGEDGMDPDDESEDSMLMEISKNE